MYTYIQICAWKQTCDSWVDKCLLRLSSGMSSCRANVFFFKDEFIIRMQAGACHHPMGRNMHKAQVTHALRGITNIDVYIDLPISLIYSYIFFLTLKLL